MDQPHKMAPRSPRTWMVVALTLGVVAFVILAFVGGLVTGVAISGTDEASSVRDAGSTGQAPGTSRPRSGGAVDPCLVGTWRTVEHSESADTDQGKVTITGVDRTLEITADGTETVTYGSGPATVTTDQGEGTATYTGTVVYDITAENGTMSFGLRSAEGTLAVATDGKEPQEQELKPGTGSVTYTCSGDRITQKATGFRSVLQRIP
ncbi:MAG: hypothetical protein ACRCSN_22255 [Dermatophilaceae bacterium]